MITKRYTAAEIGRGKKRKARAKKPSKGKAARLYRIVWKRDDLKTSGILFPGPLTHAEALTVLSKVTRRPGRRDVLEEITEKGTVGEVHQSGYRPGGYVSSSEARGPGSATKTVRGMKVHRTRILGTNHYVYSAWEPSVMMGAERGLGHGSITSGLGETWGGWWGQIGTANLPADIGAIAVGPARWAAIDPWRKKENARAHAVIVAAFPEAASGEKRDHEIEVWA